MELDCAGRADAATEKSMHWSALFTMPKMKERQESLASHWAWHASAVVIPLGSERGVALPLPDGAEPHTSRRWRGEPETEAMRTEAAMILVKDCILKVVDLVVVVEMIMK